MFEVAPFPLNEIAPSVRALLAAFHEDTQRKLDIAPTDSAPIYQRASDGWLSRVDEDGWISDSDADLDKADAIVVTLTRVRDTERSR
ncbi:hypothetical protein ACQP1G_15430 [Nocardia sp. CA-107356]|uniref:hypothetical protein n=1 Tax=Nocardia sp. CA-107356 TaxID=3239972 RepID=UPI003D8C4963